MKKRKIPTFPDRDTERFVNFTSNFTVEFTLGIHFRKRAKKIFKSP